MRVAQVDLTLQASDLPLDAFSFSFVGEIVVLLFFVF